MPNNIGAFGENFPYSNFHDMNQDWMIRIMRDFKDNYSSITENVEQAGTEALENIHTAETEALGRIDNSVNETERRYIFLGDSYGTRTNEQGLTYYDLLKASMGLTNENSYFRAAPGAAFGHQSGASYVEVLQAMTGIEHPETITDIYIQCGANDIGYTVAQETAGMNAFMDYVKVTYPKAKCWIFACGLIMNQEELLKRRLETLLTFHNMSVRGFRYILNSETVLMNTVILAEDRCHPNQFGVQYIANQLGMAVATGMCDNAYRAYQSQLGTTLSIENLPNGVSINDSSCIIQMDTKNELTEVFVPERIIVELDTNGVTLTTSNYIDIDMDNCFGILVEEAKVPVQIVNAVSGSTIIGTATYTKTDSNKYRIQIRPMFSMALGDSNATFHIYFRFNFINS